MIARISAWLDSRTRYRRARMALLDEPIPSGTGWLFTLGYLQLAFWKGVLAIFIWPYYLGTFFTTLPH